MRSYGRSTAPLASVSVGAERALGRGPMTGYTQQPRASVGVGRRSADTRVGVGDPAYCTDPNQGVPDGCIPLGPAAAINIAAGANGNLVFTPVEPFDIARLEIPETIAAQLEITQILIGRCNLMEGGVVPALLFQPQSTMCSFLRGRRIFPSVGATITFTNFGGGPVRVNASLIGTAVGCSP